MEKKNFAFTKDQQIPIKDCPVFLPGWGFDGRITELADLPQPFLSATTFLNPGTAGASLASFLDAKGIESIILSGWSMGAYLAMDFALAFPKRVGLG